ncbi:hypothetical protein D0A34_05435 [Microcoleus vaginatus PCC 9802]|uniref:hypothetical protein n=1 Tax=Microcoleus vaginatus TaxID=119532 RepID=UPI00058787C8|nr:hypothetical protein D0A34_05435 [Microcoleus vaginatus PCC 9802]
MTILAETWEYPRICNNREINKALKAFFTGKLETDSLLQTVPALKNMVKSATVLQQARNQCELKITSGKVALGIDRICSFTKIC